MNTESKSARIVGTIIGSTARFAWDAIQFLFYIGCGLAFVFGVMTWLS